MARKLVYPRIPRMLYQVLQGSSERAILLGTYTNRKLAQQAIADERANTPCSRSFCIVAYVRHSPNRQLSLWA